MALLHSEQAEVFDYCLGLDRPRGKRGGRRSGTFGSSASTGPRYELGQDPDIVSSNYICRPTLQTNTDLRPSPANAQRLATEQAQQGKGHEVGEAHVPPEGTHHVFCEQGLLNLMVHNFNSRGIPINGLYSADMSTMIPALCLLNLEPRHHLVCIHIHAL